MYVIDLSTKNKIKRRGFIFSQKSNIETVGNRKKYFLQLIHSENSNFSYTGFSENAQCFVGTFL